MEKDIKVQGRDIKGPELKYNPEDIKKISEAEEKEGLSRKIDDLKQLNNEAEENIKKLEAYRIIFRDCKGSGNQRELNQFVEFENLVSECEKLEDEVLTECLNLDTLSSENINDIRKDALGLILKLQRIQQKITRCYSLISRDEQIVRHKEFGSRQINLENQEKEIKEVLIKVEKESNQTKETLERINVSTISVMGIFVCIFSLVNVNMSYFKSLVSTSDNILEVVAFFLIINGTAIFSLIALFSLIHKFIEKNPKGEDSNELKNTIFYKREYLISMLFLGIGLFFLYKAPKIYQKDIKNKEINELKRRISTLEEKLKSIENLDSKVNINYYRN